MDFHKFSFRFDSKKLGSDLIKCQHKEWPLHFNKNDYTGTWSSYSLRSISGKEDDILATPNAQFFDTEALSNCKYLQEIINFFECEKEAIRLLSLSPNSFIKEHTDANAGYKDGFFRIHVPIQTNDQVIFKVSGHLLPMKMGECWYADFNLPHYVSNYGKCDRIHLVIDCIRNEWSDKLFAAAGYDFETEKRVVYNKENILQMIECLKIMNTETANKLIVDLELELEKII